MYAQEWQKQINKIIDTNAIQVTYSVGFNFAGMLGLKSDFGSDKLKNLSIQYLSGTTRADEDEQSFE